MVPVPSDGAEGDLTRPAENVPPAVPVGPPGDAASPHASDDDSSDEIDTYMAQLLDRINQRSSSPSAADAVPPPPPHEDPAGSKPHPALPTSEPESEARPAATSDPPAPAADEPAAQRKRSVPPERAADIVAMRQLAISSARDAIERYSAKRYNREAGDKLMVAVVLGMMSGLSAWTAHGSHVMLGTAAVGFTASAFCFFRSLQLYGHARRARHRANAPSADA